MGRHARIAAHAEGRELNRVSKTLAQPGWKPGMRGRTQPTFSSFRAGQFGETPKSSNPRPAGTLGRRRGQLRDQLQTTAISCFELSGARAGKCGDHLRRLLTALPVLPLDRTAAEQAALVRQHLESSDSPIGMADSCIACRCGRESPPLRAGSQLALPPIPGRAEYVTASEVLETGTG